MFLRFAFFLLNAGIFYDSGGLWASDDICDVIFARCKLRLPYRSGGRFAISHLVSFHVVFVLVACILSATVLAMHRWASAVGVLFNHYAEGRQSVRDSLFDTLS